MTTSRFHLYRKLGLYLAQAGRAGRGLFYDNAIANGELIETMPVLLCPADDAGKLGDTLLRNYVFQDITPGSGASLIAMGALSFCNHLADANAAYARERTPKGIVFTLRAIRDIPAGTEICINYGLTWFAGRR